MSETATTVTPSADGHGFVGVTTITNVFENGQLVSSTTHRRSLEPGTDVSEYPENVRTFCAAAWTPDVVTAWQQQVVEQQARVAARTQT